MTQKQKKKIWRIIDITEVVIVLLIPVLIVLFTSGFFTQKKWALASSERKSSLVFTTETSALMGALNLQNVTGEAIGTKSSVDFVAEEFLLEDEL